MIGQAIRLNSFIYALKSLFFFIHHVIVLTDRDPIENLNPDNDHSDQVIFNLFLSATSNHLMF